MLSMDNRVNQEMPRVGHVQGAIKMAKLGKNSTGPNFCKARLHCLKERVLFLIGNLVRSRSDLPQHVRLNRNCLWSVVI